MTESTQDHRKLARGVLVNVLGMAAKTSRVLYLILFSRWLGAELFGVYLLAFAIAELVSKIALLGLDKGAMFIAGVLKGQNRGDEIREQVERLVLMVLLTGGLGAGLLYLFSDSIAVGLLGKPMLAGQLRAFCLWIPGTCGTYTLILAIRATLDLRYEVYVQSVVEPLLVLVFGAVALLANLGVRGVGYANSAASVVTFAFAFYCFRRVFPVRAVTKPPSKIAWKSVWANGFPMGMTDLLTQFKLRLDLIVIGRLLPLSAVGMYGAVVETSGIIRKLRSAFDSIVMPLSQSLHLQKESKRLNDSLALSIRWIMLPTLGVVMTMILVPGAYLQFFGSDFMQGSTSLRIFAFGQLAFVTLGLLEGVLNITGFAFVPMVNSIVFVIVNVILLWLLIPLWGIAGAALATSAGTIGIAVWRLAQAKRRLHIWPFERAQLKPLVSFLLTLGIGFGVVFVWPATDLRVQIPYAVLFMLLYCVFLFWFGFEAQETDVATRVRKRISRRGPPPSAT